MLALGAGRGEEKGGVACGERGRGSRRGMRRRRRRGSGGMAGAWLAVIFPRPAAGCSAGPLPLIFTSTLASSTEGI